MQRKRSDDIIVKLSHLSRFNKPIPILLLLLPIWWTLVITRKFITDFWFYFSILTLGGILSRTVGCIINDIIDRKYDAFVKRTAKRPLAKNSIEMKYVIMYLLLLSAIGLFLIFLLPLKCRYIICISCLLMCIYPYMKRITNYAQVVLGIAFNTGILVTFTLSNYNNLIVQSSSYIAAVLWTIGYDAIYALQDVHDDKALGLRSIAVKFEKSISEVVWYCYKITCILLGFVGLNLGYNIAFFVFLGGGLYSLYEQIKVIESHSEYTDKIIYEKLFHQNAIFGIIVLIALYLGQISLAS
ncbi:4-hydroxybenzoate octaprenyltransferase/polyprenyltransferase UbiA [Candidatus Fokinia solitaria]|uniref:4-hydroxybenzoate polyprenyltransferase n=1 Tax=Candidatus Fokinia solitaria TaxID=1802984 RepID=A0A2U8BSA4_9RICK|nr:4-hydroxybenzoate octaprenyltransferase [Candidatus Fokinia solitaria]AWD33221.1 4-hydroxybenzoate octaprenyltransferase/polyprenyltransferase UbiA [Candidatus Fokinia solitaria]